jgi:hypothetical protein
MRAIHARHACLGLLDATTTTHKKKSSRTTRNKKVFAFFLFVFAKGAGKKKQHKINSVETTHPSHSLEKCILMFIRCNFVC